jgi:GT2 family glycosyltransferase
MSDSEVETLMQVIGPGPTRPLTISAYVPFSNNAETVLEAIRSVAAQTVPPESIVAIDDGSTDGGAELLEAQGFRVVRNQRNLGRGATRNRAMLESTGDLVLSCDATNRMAPEFVERALPWFADPRVAAVFGRMLDPHPEGVAGRWRARHLLKCKAEMPASRCASLSTGGALLRRSAVLGVGNFDVALRHSEDAELGERLAAAGFDIAFDPRVAVFCNIRNTIPQVLERYWRWHAGRDERVTWLAYLRLVSYSVKGMIALDLADRDPQSALISVICPHYQFWRSKGRRKRPERGPGFSCLRITG